MKKFEIYKATNQVNGNFYLGAASNGMLSRQKAHIWDAQSGRGGCKVFHRAITKYGKESFTWQVVETLSSFEEMMKREIELIAELKPQYNMTIGGEGIVGLTRTKEWYEKVSKSLKAKGIRPPGRTDFSSAHKPIVCLNDGKYFKSIVAAAEHFGIRKNATGEVLHGRQTHTRGLSFVYSNKPLSTEQCTKKLAELAARIERNTLRLASGSSRNKPVLCTTDGKLHAGGAAAARFYGISPMTVSNLCNKGGRTRAGLSFKFAESN